MPCRLQLFGEPLMPRHPLLRCQVPEPLGLSQVASVVRDDRDLEIKATQPDQSPDVVEARRGPARFPACDPWLRRTCPRRQLSLGQAGTSSRFTNQITAEHLLSITDRLCQPWQPQPATAAVTSSSQVLAANSPVAPLVMNAYAIRVPSVVRTKPASE